MEPAVHGDSRGYFMETYSQRNMEEAGINYNFVQDNQSMSTKGVLRGLHFQINYSQINKANIIKTETAVLADEVLAFPGKKQRRWRWSRRTCSELPIRIFPVSMGRIKMFSTLCRSDRTSGKAKNGSDQTR